MDKVNKGDVGIAGWATAVLLGYTNVAHYPEQWSWDLHALYAAKGSKYQQRNAA